MERGGCTEGGVGEGEKNLIGCSWGCGTTAGAACRGQAPQVKPGATAEQLFEGQGLLSKAPLGIWASSQKQAETKPEGTRWRHSDRQEGPASDARVGRCGPLPMPPAWAGTWALRPKGIDESTGCGANSVLTTKPGPYAARGSLTGWDPCMIGPH